MVETEFYRPQRKPVILLTLYRRYHELRKNLRRTRDRALIELGDMPDVVLVWADPEVGRMWVIQELQAEGLITHVLSRKKMEGEGVLPTTFLECHNLRLGLRFIREQYDPATHYVVMHAADVALQDETLQFFDQRINGKVEEGFHDAVLLHWGNGNAFANVWATNCFAVCLREEYWPPVVGLQEQDVLERAWGKQLAEARLPGVFAWHNAHERRYAHRHESEDLPPLPFIPQKTSEGLALICKGWKPWHLRLWDGLKSFGKGVWRFLDAVT